MQIEQERIAAEQEAKERAAAAKAEEERLARIAAEEQRVRDEIELARSKLDSDLDRLLGDKNLRKHSPALVENGLTSISSIYDKKVEDMQVLLPKLAGRKLHRYVVEIVTAQAAEEERVLQEQKLLEAKRAAEERREKERQKRLEAEEVSFFSLCLLFISIHCY